MSCSAGTILLVCALITLLNCGDALHCYKCMDEAEITGCQNITCGTSQNCFTERYGDLPYARFTMGCLDQIQCPDKPSQGFSLVGRDVETRGIVPDCRDCCSSDLCNDNLCDARKSVATVSPHTTTAPCNDTDNNCAILNTTYHVCLDVARAEAICRKFCNLCDLIDGQWNVWSRWTSCSVSCGNGHVSRLRTCSNPPPAHGGADCIGNDTDVKSCYLRDCPIHGGWTSWGHWESCSQSCGVGLTTRHRSCTNPVPSIYGHYCYGDPLQTNLCNGTNCTAVSPAPPPNPSGLCVDEVPTCDVFNSTYGICSDSDRAQRLCKKFCNYCGLVDGGWATWTAWGKCSVTCGDGTKTRSRTCSFPAPANGGRQCQGQNSETTACKEHICPVHGGWSMWSSWSSCSVTCGKGLTHRQRFCNNPTPTLFGAYCFGEHDEYNLCVVQSCAVNGNWGSWSAWSSCSSNCSRDIRQRHRACNNPAPAFGGSICSDVPVEYKLCWGAKCEVRLNNNGFVQNSEGRVEIFHNGQWFTICDDVWNNLDATVVCRMFGHTSGTAFSNAHYGQGSGPILRYVQCTGSEANIQQCPLSDWQSTGCSHTEDAGVLCS